MPPPVSDYRATDSGSANGTDFGAAGIFPDYGFDSVAPRPAVPPSSGGRSQWLVAEQADAGAIRDHNRGDLRGFQANFFFWTFYLFYDLCASDFSNFTSDFTIILRFENFIERYKI